MPERTRGALRHKTRFVIPNMITAASLVMGLVSIFFTQRHDFETAAWVILYSTILDKLDGTTARALNASTSFGTEFDSFSDFTAFGLAPAFLIFTYFTTDPSFMGSLQGGELPFFLYFAVILFILSSATRLARFNITSVPGSHYILGLTTTVTGGLVSSAFLSGYAHRSDPTVHELMGYLPYMLIVFSALMLSTFPSVKPGGRGSKARNIQDALVFMALVLLVLARQLPEVLLLAGIIATLIGFAIGYKHRDEALGRGRFAPGGAADAEQSDDEDD